jgi:hypothetical protein
VWAGTKTAAPKRPNQGLLLNSILTIGGARREGRGRGDFTSWLRTGTTDRATLPPRPQRLPSRLYCHTRSHARQPPERGDRGHRRAWPEARFIHIDPPCIVHLGQSSQPWLSWPKNVNWSKALLAAYRLRTTACGETGTLTVMCPAAALVMGGRWCNNLNAFIFRAWQSGSGHPGCSALAMEDSSLLS